MNRRIVILLILIGFFSIVGLGAYSIMNGLLEIDQTSEVTSEEVSEVKSEEVSEVESESQVDETEVDETEVEKDPNEGVETTVPEETTGDETSTDDIYDENGDLKENSKYLDADGDTIANYYDICPGVDDFSDECETDAYDTKTATTDTSDNTTSADSSTSDDNLSEDTGSSTYDENGDLRENSKYLDADGDTVANYYDICPGVDDFSDECEDA